MAVPLEKDGATSIVRDVLFAIETTARTSALPTVPSVITNLSPTCKVDVKEVPVPTIVTIELLATTFPVLGALFCQTYSPPLKLPEILLA